MAWIESHTVLGRHRKLLELSSALRLRPAYVAGHLHLLWHAALEQQEDGNLSSWSDEFIANRADFPGDAPQFVRLLQDHKWLDGKIIHDWLDYAGRYLESKYKTSKPIRLQEIWQVHGLEYVPGRRKGVPKEDHSPPKDFPPTIPTNQPDLPNQPTAPHGRNGAPQDGLGNGGRNGGNISDDVLILERQAILARAGVEGENLKRLMIRRDLSPEWLSAEVTDIESSSGIGSTAAVLIDRIKKRKRQ